MENKKVYGVAVKKSEIPKTVYGAAKLKETNYAVLKEAADFVANGGQLSYSKYSQDKKQDLRALVASKKDEALYKQRVDSYNKAIDAALSVSANDKEFVDSLNLLKQEVNNIGEVYARNETYKKNYKDSNLSKLNQGISAGAVFSGYQLDEYYDTFRKSLSNASNDEEKGYICAQALDSFIKKINSGKTLTSVERMYFEKISNEAQRYDAQDITANYYLASVYLPIYNGANPNLKKKIEGYISAASNTDNKEINAWADEAKKYMSSVEEEKKFTNSMSTIYEKLSKGKALTFEECEQLKKYGAYHPRGSLKDGTVLNLKTFTLPDNSAFKKYRETYNKISSKIKNGEKLTSEEWQIKYTVEALENVSKQLLGGLTEDIYNNRKWVNNIKALGLTNDALYGYDENKLAQMMDRTKIYLGTGLSNYIGGNITAFDAVTGKSVYAIANESQNEYQIASAYLREYFTDTKQHMQKTYEDLVVNVAQNIIPMVGSMLAANGLAAPAIKSMTGVKGAATRFVLKNTGEILMGVSAFGNAYKEGVQLGVTDKGKLWSYSIAVAASETLLEKALGSTVNIKGGKLSNAITDKLTATITNSLLRGASKTVGKAAGEFLEESIQSVLNPFFQKYILGLSETETLFDDPIGQLKGAAYDGFIGFLSSIFMGGFSGFQEAATENALISKGENFKDTLNRIDVKISDIAEYLKALSDSTTLTKLAQQVIDGDTSDLTIGKLINEAERYSESCSNAIFVKLGEKIFKTNNGVETLFETYETVVEKGALYPEYVVSLYETVKSKHLKGDIDMTSLGKFAYYVDAVMPRAVVLGEIYKKSIQNEQNNKTATTSDSERNLNAALSAVTNKTSNNSVDNMVTAEDGKKILLEPVEKTQSQQKNSQDNIIDLSEDNTLSALVENIHGSKRYTIIKNFILGVLKGKTVVLSDGKQAVVDKSDAKHISSNAGSEKTAIISKILKVIESAELVAEEDSSDNNKFTKFYYYETFVKYKNNIFPIYLNVGLTKNDKNFHIYDITKKLRDTAHRVNDVGRPVGNALKNGISNDSISNNEEKVNNNSIPKNGADEDRAVFTTPSEKEIYREPSSDEKVAAMLGKMKSTVQRQVEAVAGDFGIKMIWSEKITVDDGIYDPVNRTITLNPNTTLSDAYIFLFKHEFVHSLEIKKGYVGYKDYLYKSSIAFEEYIRNELKESFGIDFEGTRQEVIDKYVEVYWDKRRNAETIPKSIRDAYTRESIEREIVADFVADNLLGAKDGVQDFSKVEAALSEMANTHRNLFQKIIDSIKDWITKLKGAPQNRTLVEDLEYLNRRLMRVYDSPTNKKAANDSGVKHSFKNTKNGLSNDLLLHYDAELTNLIEQRGDYIIDSLDKLKNVVDIAFNNPKQKSTAYFGIIPAEILSKIENSIPNIPKELNGALFKGGKTYSVAATLDSIQHLADNKSLTREDIVEYLDKMADTIVNFDTVNFDYYYQGNQKSKGIIFKKKFKDGTIQSFEIVSSKKRTLNLQTIYMENGDYQKKKSAETLLMEKPSADAQGAGRSDSNISIPIKEKTVKNNISEESKNHSDNTENSGSTEQHAVRKRETRVDDPKKMAKKLLRAHRSSMNKVELQEYIEEIVKDINKSEYGAAMSKAMKAAQQVFGSSKAYDIISDEARDILNYVRTAAIKLDEAQKEEVATVYGSYNEFRKKNLGRLNLKNDGSSLDSWWQELSTEFPQVFDPDTNSGDMPLALANIVDRLANTYEAYDENAAIEYIATQIFSECANSKYNKINNDLVKAVKEANKSFKQQRKGYVNEIDRLERKIQNRNEFDKNRREAKSKNELIRKTKNIVERLDRLLNKSNKKSNVKEGQRETVSALLKAAEVIFNDDVSNESLVKRGLEGRTDVERYALEEYKKLLEKRDGFLKKAQELGEHTQNPEIAKQINNLTYLADKTSKQIRDFDKVLKELFAAERQKLSNVKVNTVLDELIKAYKKTSDSDDFYIAQAFNEEILKRLEALNEEIGETVAVDMTEVQLQALYDGFEMIQTVVRSANKAFINGKWLMLNELTDDVKNDLKKNTRERKDKLAVVSNAEHWTKHLLTHNLKPYYFFDLLESDSLMNLFRDSLEADGVKGQILDETINFFAEANKKYGQKKWGFNVASTVSCIEGAPIMTLGEKMTVYAHYKRKQAHKHIFEGGYQFAENSKYKTARNGAVHSRGDTSTTYTLSLQQMKQISDTLTKEQREYVDAITGFFSGPLAKKANRVTKTLYGIELFKEENYFPIRCSKDYIKTQTPEPGQNISSTSLLNLGITQNTNPAANNPVILEDFTLVAARHIEEMAYYTSFAEVVNNMHKVFGSFSIEKVTRISNSQSKANEADNNTETDSFENVLIDTTNRSSITAAIRKAFGVEAEMYIGHFLVDLNGGVNASGVNGVWEKLFTTSKKVSVAANASVIIRQPLAAFRAMAVMNPKYFIPVLNSKYSATDEKTQWEEMKKYFPLALTKDLGGYDIGSGRTVYQELVKVQNRLSAKKIKYQFDDAIMKGAQIMDHIGWSTIWRAIKKEIAIEQRLQPGTAEFFEACRVRATDVFAATQVYDSVNSRSGFMRSKHAFNRVATSYMGEPTTTVNMYYASAVKLARAVQRKDVEAIRKRTMGFVQTSAALIFTGAICDAAVVALVYAARDDDEDESFWERWAKHYGEALFEELIFVNKIPFIRDLWSIIEGYTQERAETELIGEVVSAFKNLLKDDHSKEEIGKLILTILNVFGIPASNFWRDIKAVINIFEDVKEGRDTTDMRGTFKSGFTPSKDDDDFTLIDRAVSAYEKGDMELAEKAKDELYEKHKEKYISDGYEKSKAEELAKNKVDNDFQKAMAERRSEDITKEVTEYMEDLEDNQTFAEFSKKDQKDLKKKIKTAVTEGMYIEETVSNLEDYDKLYELKRMNTTSFKIEKEKVIAGGVTEAQFNERLEYAKIKYMKSLGLDVHEYLMLKIATSKKYADTNKSGGVSTPEKNAAINRADVDSKAKQVYRQHNN